MVYSDLSAKGGLPHKNDVMHSRRRCFGRLALARTQPVVLVVAVLVASLFGLQGAAQGQGTLETVIPDFGVNCSSTGQLCEPPFAVTVATQSLLQVQYAVRFDHCSSVRLHIFVDNVLVQTTDFLGWPGAGAPFDVLPLETGLLDVGPVAPGTHVLALQAEGQESGCNTGNLSAWGGSLRVLTTPLFTVVTDSSMSVPGGSGVFTAFPEGSAVSARSVGFLGLGSAGEEGVYSCDIFTPVDPCRKIADLFTAIPQGTGTFTGFTQLAAGDTLTSFIGTGSGQAGVYSCDSAAPTDPCRKIADLFTAIPQGTGTFTGFTSVSTSLEHTAFLGLGRGGQAGIYLASTPTRVLAVGDRLHGKTVTALHLGRFGLDRLRLTFTATFADGSEGVFVAQVATYPLTGFFEPVNNLPVLNQAKAGSAIPVKFSLGSDQGLAIFATGYPKSEQIACDSTAPVDGIEQTVTAGGSSLAYDPATDQYTYVWKTAKAWANTCQQLVLKLNDNSVHRANFTFK